MKAFLEKLIESSSEAGSSETIKGDVAPARLAVYDSLLVSPYIIELSAESYDEFIGLLSTKAYQASQEKGGSVPFTVIKEIVENLIHACFNEVTITILDNGNTIRISDQGPGIKDKDRAVEPGFSTATKEMKRFIKGVGSGLPVARESLSFLGGSIRIEDNLNSGTVVTLSLPTAENDPEESADEKIAVAKEIAGFVKLNKRQRQVLFLVTELGAVGPSVIASELSISLSTAYRDLALLQEIGLVESLANGKRALTASGIEQLDQVLNS